MLIGNSIDLKQIGIYLIIIIKYWNLYFFLIIIFIIISYLN